MPLGPKLRELLFWAGLLAVICLIAWIIMIATFGGLSTGRDFGSAAHVEPDNRTTLCGECETFRLAIQKCPS